MDATIESTQLQVKRNDPLLTSFTIQPPWSDAMGELGGEIGQDIGKNTQLTCVRVDFEGVQHENGVTATSLLPFFRGLAQNRSINKICLTNCHYGLFGTGILEILVPFLEQNHQLRGLDLYRSHLGSVGARMLSGALERRRVKSLTRMNLGYTPPLLTSFTIQPPWSDAMGELGGEIGQDIGKNTQLTCVRVDFEGVQHENGVTATSLLPFFRGIAQNRSIQGLALTNCNYDLFSTGILEILVPFLEQNHQLRGLDMNRSHLGSRGACMLSGALERRRVKSLTRMNLGYTRIFGESAVEELLAALSGYTNLRELNLEGTNIGFNACTLLSNKLHTHLLSVKTLRLTGLDDNKLVRLAASLATNSTLQTLKLSRNPTITNTGWFALSFLLQNANCKVSTLNLSDNTIGTDAAVDLANSLSQNRTLKKLNLCGNRSVATRGWMAFSTVLQTDSRLVALVLSECNIPNEVAVMIATSLTNNRSLRLLSFSGNLSITATGWAAFSTLFQNPDSRLVSLHLCRNNIGDEVAVSFATSLANNRRLEVLNLSGNPSITAVGWAAFSGLLCNTSSLNCTYNSNHTLKNLGDFGPESQLPHDLVHYLLLNEIDNQRKVHEKILMHHFAGDFSMEPFSEMKAELLVHVLACISNASARNNCASHSALYQFLRSKPSLLGCSNEALTNKVAGVCRPAEDDGAANIDMKKRRCY
eukprot:CAMPEP_0201946096 /NCGR_PEP_ID=MMETSP0903-20130614/54243_1 /ASSEMBLY_ACC=CAM_ASM_000552 /TAXON_ID=420261 /ORGANISM="Thalassiosira antarctica, Strain CCMP982" /LENGTH=701 /DNA_ID=CAMNT_0048489187 /DNA_START=199 /DNA_END=2303 /DNA_ORIENTATION=-